MSTQTRERGRFYIGPNGFPRFAGSSSGVFLADTVQSEVSPGNPASFGSPSIGEAFLSRNNDAPRHGESVLYDQFLLKRSDLVHEHKMRELFTKYFTTWHPLFPFLDGAYLVKCLEDALTLAQLEDAIGLTTDSSSAPSSSNTLAFLGLKSEENLILSAIFSSILAITGGNEDASRLPAATYCLRSVTSATLLAHLIIGAAQNSSVSDLFALQALVAIELYLFTTRTFRPAMHLSGTTIKLAYEAGLHRCPERYRQTFALASDRDLRRRVFWSMYTLDRLLSAEFGIPIMLHDSDIDTCVPGGTEGHLKDDSPPSPQGEPSGKRARIAGSAAERTPPDEQPQLDRSSTRLLPSYSLVEMTKMMGQAMEAFNKLVKNRTLDPQHGPQLRADLDAWWNDIGLDCDEENDVHSPDPRRRYATLYRCLYHQQIINLCRPALSLAPGQPQHSQALQTAITSARITCSTLWHAGEEEVFWPGLVDMVFFAGLILAYGARRGSVVGNARRTEQYGSDIRRAITVLERMSSCWPGVSSVIRILRELSGSLTKHGGTEAPSGASVNLDHANEPSLNDFHFDFATFELNPELNWAFHRSIPGSPVVPWTFDH